MKNVNELAVFLDKVLEGLIEMQDVSTEVLSKVNDLAFRVKLARPEIGPETAADEILQLLKVRKWADAPTGDSLKQPELYSRVGADSGGWSDWEKVEDSGSKLT